MNNTIDNIFKFLNTPSEPYVRAILRIDEIYRSSDQKLILKTTDFNNQIMAFTLNLQNRYDVSMLFSSLFNQVGFNGQKDGKDVDMELKLSALIGRWTLFTTQQYTNHSTELVYQNVRDIFLIPQDWINASTFAQTHKESLEDKNND
ncbi:hypothetical protein JCM15457_1424 [Liquorilactobacillus sucicola DSM 21376 = JCM 15457]|nr:hypothetical protein [Liquorilactobacillus sucicola]GAJ26495.1 hypothetical protein JCM15457_1424 [Liquorilactobacillus sucicola DSM 21376 = JCM 15457]